MSDQTVIPYHINGPEPSGLVTWPEIDSSVIAIGNPVQRGHEYFSTEKDLFTSGVWDCTEHELTFSNYEVDEFMIVLEGSISLRDSSGNLETFHAGESFIIPKGTPCAWVQSEYTRKFYAIFDSDTSPEQPDNLLSIRIDPNVELPRVTQHDGSQYLSEIPDMGLLNLYTDPSGKLDIGVWECSPMTRVPGTIARSELMHILEGSGSIINADGVVFDFKAGDTFLVPIGMGYQWKSEEYVKKLFCSYTP